MRAVELYPPRSVLEGEGATQQFIARAKYSDGTDRDVTNLAVFLTNNDNSAPINADGLVTAANRGEAFVMARFATHTVGSQVLVLPKDLQYTPPATPPANYIDELVNAKLQKLRIAAQRAVQRRSLSAPGDDRHHRPVADDRRVSGSSLATPIPHKRAKLVDRLLERKEFSEIWAMKWAELLMVKSTERGQLQVDVPVLELADQADFEQRAAEHDGARAARRQRRHVQEPGHELLPDRTRHAEDGRERGPGVHGHSHAVRPVPQSSVRPLDDGRLLQLRRVLLADRPQAGRGLSRDDHLQLRRRRSDASGRRTA